ncbi:MAG: hypothetical protein IK127_04750 [Clostridia bacterium]|nr:hypothetical protein [Clostridia bacterium]
MAIIRVFEQYQTAVSWKAAFSGEVKAVAVVAEEIDGFICPLETAPHGFAERAAFAFVTYDTPDGFPGAG